MKCLIAAVAAAFVLGVSASSSAANATVRITATSFTPATTSVASGDAVTWTNTTVGWVTLKSLTLGPRSARLFKAPHVRGTARYRIYLTLDQAGNGYVDSWSNQVKVRYRR